MAISKSIRRKGPAQAPRGGYRFLAVVLDSIDYSAVVEAIGLPASTGRPAFPTHAMLRAVLSKYILSFRYNLVLLERLRASPKFRQVCGFPGRVPSESTFSRFTTKLTQHQALIDECLAGAANALREILPDLGETVAIDSTAVESFANPNRKTIKDPEASWGVKHSSRAKDGDTKWFFGYKLHLLSDADYEIPLAYEMTAGNVNDSPLLPALLEKGRDMFDWLHPRYLLADRGYDSSANHHEVVRQEAVPIIHKRRPTAEDELHNGVYTKDGAPTCMGKGAMEYVRTDPETGHHLFRCPTDGCPLKAKNSGAVLYCDYEVWEDPMENLRIVGIVWRGSEEWEEHYAKRMSIERIFRSLKHSRGLEGHRYRGMAKVRLLSSLSLLCFQATVLARLITGDFKNLRIMRVKVA